MYLLVLHVLVSMLTKQTYQFETHSEAQDQPGLLWAHLENLRFDDDFQEIMHIASLFEHRGKRLPSPSV